MTREAEPASPPRLAENEESSERDCANLGLVDRPRLLRLAQQYSVMGMSRLPGIPAAQVIYQELASDAEFADLFERANRAVKQACRAELAELLKRSRTADLSRIFIALRKLRSWQATKAGLSSESYDLSLLSDDELSQFENILRKALPQSTEPAPSQEGTGNDEQRTTSA
jgi:hypothetical protein